MNELAEFRTIDLLQDLPDAEIERWIDACERREIPAGTILVDAAADPIGLVLLLRGTITGLIRNDDQFEPEVDHVAPTWLGAIPTLLRAPSPIRMVARDDLEVAIVGPEKVRDLVLTQPVVFDAVMAQMRPVLGRFGEAQRTRERLISLGTMAAGLAHELNNPASSARRASAALSESLDTLPGLVASLGGEVPDDELTLDPTQGPRSALEIADAEDALIPVLEELAIPEPWRLAASLAAAGIDAAQARTIVSRRGPKQLEWLAFLTSSRQAANDLGLATRRVSDIVNAMRDYSYLDQGPVNDVDVNASLSNTLVVLGDVPRGTAIRVLRRFASGLPQLVAHGAALSEVWTNLLLNAFAAAPDDGMIVIATRVCDGCVEVDITDNGPGVPPEVRSRIFDPFFTTRAVGDGVGLGLHSARRIVTEQHGGTLTFTSEPGHTTFRTRLPIPGESAAS
jgi:signal transduction histidine kinase